MGPNEPGVVQHSLPHALCRYQLVPSTIGAPGGHCRVVVEWQCLLEMLILPMIREYFCTSVAAQFVTAPSSVATLELFIHFSGL